MSEDNQIVVPHSFIELYLPPGRIKPTAPRDEIAARYEFCEDLASLLTEHAKIKHWDLGITEADVLERMHRGLRVDDAPVTAAEAVWVIRRLAELLDWAAPDFPPEPASVAG
jgi:hypothetical protein